MNKQDLVDAVSEVSELSKKDSAKAIDALVESITEGLSRGEKVSVQNFGHWEVRERSERKGRNPQDGSEILIPASKSPAFKPGKALKDIVKNS